MFLLINLNFKIIATFDPEFQEKRQKETKNKPQNVLGGMASGASSILTGTFIFSFFSFFSFFFLISQFVIFSKDLEVALLEFSLNLWKVKFDYFLLNFKWSTKR